MDLGRFREIHEGSAKTPRSSFLVFPPDSASFASLPFCFPLVLSYRLPHNLSQSNGKSAV